MSIVVPVAIVTGIIEDKIANDLSSEDNKNKIIEHLEDIKKKIKKNSFKPPTKLIKVIYKQPRDDGSREELLEVEDMRFISNFVCVKIKDGHNVYYNTDEITAIGEEA